MSQSTSSFDLQRLREHIRPFRLHWFPRLRSTNDHAARLRRLGKLYAPAIVLTGNQIAGRGRGSNSWWSGEGSLTVTFVFPVDSSLEPYQVPLLAGVAARSAIAQLCAGADVQLKWPNDVLFRGKKLAGLLCERIDKADLVGLGLNVNVNLARVPKPLGARVTSMNAIARRSFDMTDVLIALAARLHQVLAHRDEHSFPAMLAEYDRHHALAGRRVTVATGSGEPPISGTCTGLDNMGRLLLQNRRTIHRIISGEIRV
ncbi:MAG TPA: biotin--[acetyl-CoA-carboxylase] ligase [Tepidisphaeraceae bacterium]|jgi:BirA family biotin operon repressor/biotin-[acetyl-CoA-carboxylase] ligase|nr:biotin--[acetyl-CoA-carboxylase] ligase [Tepidisphaeraceae bacterium]